jgi:very-short-patch-repair endonuclease
MSNRGVDRAIEAIARRQHGTFSRRQAEVSGATARMIQGRRSSGAWLTLDSGVYALNGLPGTWLRQAKAAELRVPGSAVSHRAAAHILGIDGHPAGPIDVVTESRPPRSRLATVHHLDGISIVRRSHIVVTSVPLTVLQLAGIEGKDRLARTVDDVLLKGMSTLDELQTQLRNRAVGWRGIGALRDILDECGDGYEPPESELERRLARVLDDPRLPAWVRQARLPWLQAGHGRVDALIPEWRRIVEADGRRWHTRRADFDRDRARDHLAQRNGYEVTRFTHRQLADPTYAVGVLLAIGARRAA